MDQEWLARSEIGSGQGIKNPGDRSENQGTAARRGTDSLKQAKPTRPYEAATSNRQRRPRTVGERLEGGWVSSGPRGILPLRV